MKIIKFSTILLIVSFNTLFAQLFSWSPLHKITNYGIFYTDQPDLFIDKNDSLYLSFLRHDRGADDFISLYFTKGIGDTWSEPLKLTDSAFVYSQKIVKDSKGNIFICYARLFGDYGESFVIKNENSVWQEPMPIAYEYSGHSEYPEMVIDGNDNIYVFYSTFYGIYWRKYDGKNWSEIDTVTTIPDWQTVIFQSKAVVDNNNNVHVIYNSYGSGPGTTALYYKKYNGSEWTETERISEISFSFGWPRDFSITTDLKNQPHVVFTLPNHSSYNAIILFYTNFNYKRNYWSQPDSITTEMNGEVFLPKIEITPNNYSPIVLAVIDTSRVQALRRYNNFFIYEKESKWIIERIFDKFPEENTPWYRFDFEYDSQKNINYVFTAWDLYYTKGVELTNIKNDKNNYLANFNLKAYPNPFNNTVKINYSLPFSEITKITIFDTLGREIKKIFSEYKAKGEHEINFNADNLSSGVYLIELKTAKFSKTCKILLAK